MGRRDEAEDHYLQAIAIRPDYWRHYNMLGGFYYSIGRIDDAIAAFTRRHPAAAGQRRRISQPRGRLLPERRHAQRLDQLREGDRDPADGGNAFRHRQHSLRRGSIRRGARGVSAGGRRRAERRGAARQRRRCLCAAESARTPRGRRGARRSGSTSRRSPINPNDATILARLALREAKLGDRAAAESHITRALTFGANDAEVLYHSAVVRALAGDTERALDSLEQALKNGYSANVAAADRDLDAIRNTPTVPRASSAGEDATKEIRT